MGPPSSWLPASASSMGSPASRPPASSSAAPWWRGPSRTNWFPALCDCKGRLGIVTLPGDPGGPVRLGLQGYVSWRLSMAKDLSLVPSRG
eukprot:641234-Pyramimonas_sp.AAC.1